jgi:DNA-binding MarR family transcriptional regulator
MTQSFQLDRSLTHRLHSLGKITDRLTQQAYQAQTGLSLSDGRCLAAVGAFGPFSVNDLASFANLNKGQASRAAQALVEQGLVQKDSVPSDARGVMLSLTAQGTAIWARLQAVIAQRNEDIAACLSVEERAQLDALLDRLVAHAREQGSAAEPV